MRLQKLLYLIFVLILCVSCSINESKIDNLQIKRSGTNKSGTYKAERLESTPVEKKVNNGVFLENEDLSGKTRNEVAQIIRNYSLKIDKPAKDAVMDPKTWEVVENEAYGKDVDENKLLEQIMNAAEGTMIKLIVNDVPPSVTAETLKANIVEIANFNTPLLDKQPSRIKNIQLALSSINGYILNPNEEFSFNKVVGNRTQERGYEVAPAIIKKDDDYEMGYEVGGGVCQISTTLYNAALNCGLKITERHEHSKPIPYVEEGKDATVSYGAVDLRFVNNRSHPIKLSAYIEGDCLYVAIIENKNL